MNRHPRPCLPAGRPDDRYYDPDCILPSDWVFQQAREGRVSWRNACVIVLAEFHALQQAEIAAIFATGKSTIHRRLRASRGRLRKMYATIR